MNPTRTLRDSWLTLGALLVLGAVAYSADNPAPETLPPGAKLVRLEAQPASITLKTPFAYTQLLLTGQLDNGDKVDVTRLAQVENPANLVSVSPRLLVRPAADGSGELKFNIAGQSVTVPVTVSGQKEKYEVSFVRDVMPVMSKIGCNAGTCHGAQQGKNGFKLSLRGYDPPFDHQALTDDIQGRRFNRAAPDTSLMLLKTSGAAPHVGGALIQPGEPSYELLRSWIAEGVKLDLNSPRVTGIDILPKGPVVPLIGMKQQMAVLATYSDGSVRDVSAHAFIEASNTEVTTADKQGLVTAVRRGETAIMARYEGAYTATPLIVMGDRSGFVWKDQPENNFIDALVYEKLKAVKVLPSDLCTDGEFIRRVTIDLTGLPPEAEAVRAFLTDPRPTQVKRDELIDRLIGSPDFVEHWTNKWADLLQVNRKFLGEPGAKALREWIRKAIAENMPYDQFAHAVLTASGSTLDNPPAAYFKVLRDPGSTMENTTQLFLAIRFNCNKCHDHPFERWTQNQYYELSAFFARVERKEAESKFKGQKVGGTNVDAALPLVETIAEGAAGEVKHERTGAVTPPSFPYKHNDLAATTASRREQLAHWITSKDNPYFARSYVNRMWSYLLGVGIIEPVDDIRAGNPPSNPKLLDRLTADFIDSGFNVQHVVRTICKSRAYQRSLVTNPWNKDDDINYSHALARRLPAEVLFDAIHRVTGSQSRLPGLPPGARAAQLIDSNAEGVDATFLGQFGKPARESACECERSSGVMLGPVLGLVNGPVLADALKDPNNRLAKLTTTEKDDARIVEELFLAVLARMPTEVEKAAALKELAGHRDEFAQMVEDYNAKASAVAQREQELTAKQADWEKNLQAAPAWTVLEPTSFKSAGGTTLKKQSDNSILASGKNPTPEVYTVTANTKVTGITAIRLELLADPSLPQKGPGRGSANGNLVLNEFRVTAASEADPVKAVAVVLHKALADFSQEGYGVAGAIDGKPDTGWALAGQTGKSHTAVFETKEPLTIADGAVLTFTLDQQYPGKEHNIGRFRLSVTTSKPPIALEGPPEAIGKILAVEAEQRTPEQKVQLTNFYFAQDQELQRRKQVLAQATKPGDPRLIGAQDLVWVLINTKAFLFNY
jgi:hypothetical protein